MDTLSPSGKVNNQDAVSPSYWKQSGFSEGVEDSPEISEMGASPMKGGKFRKQIEEKKKVEEEKKKEEEEKEA